MADGLLLVDKPSGLTSHDAVAMARRAYNESSVGHLGTLDPFATGLLLLLLGRCTRLATFINIEPKVYEATMRFGAATDTDDATGDIVREAPLPSEHSLRNAITNFMGDFDQLPPAYSAKLVNGRRAYHAARSGHPLTLSPAKVHVDAWDVLDVRYGATEQRVEEMDVRITCGTGTYIRALARDLGAIVGSAAHCKTLRRTHAGEFAVAQAHALEKIESYIQDQTRPLPSLLALRVYADG